MSFAITPTISTMQQLDPAGAVSDLEARLGHDNAGFGYAIFLDGRDKLAVFVQSHHAGLYRNGVGLKEPLPTDLWSLHWTGASMTIDVAEAVIHYCRRLPPPAPAV